MMFMGCVLQSLGNFRHDAPLEDELSVQYRASFVCFVTGSPRRLEETSEEASLLHRE